MLKSRYPSPSQKRRRLRPNNNNKTKGQKQALCYSLGGYLVDTLEDNGFVVRTLECYGRHRKEFRIDVEVPLDDDRLKALLRRHFKRGAD